MTIFFHPMAEAISECGGVRDVDRRVGIEGGRVSCERIHAVEFCILSLAACGLKQHPPTHRNSRYAKECTREREKEGEEDGEEGTCGWPLVIFIGRVYRRALGTKKKEKKARVAQRARAKSVEAREKERAGNVE